MSTGARELMPMSSFNPSEAAILHDRITDSIETWAGEEEADYRETSVTLVDGTVAWRAFEFDGWGNVLGG
jgi:hypothetical protein